jgi:hypothetical protein
MSNVIATLHTAQANRETRAEENTAMVGIELLLVPDDPIALNGEVIMSCL